MFENLSHHKLISRHATTYKLNTSICQRRITASNKVLGKMKFMLQSYDKNQLLCYTKYFALFRIKKHQKIKCAEVFSYANMWNVVIQFFFAVQTKVKMINCEKKNKFHSIQSNSIQFNPIQFRNLINLRHITNSTFSVCIADIS